MLLLDEARDVRLKRSDWGRHPGPDPYLCSFARLMGRPSAVVVRLWSRKDGHLTTITRTACKLLDLRPVFERPKEPVKRAIEG